MLVKRTMEMSASKFESSLSCNSKAYETVVYLGSANMEKVWKTLEEALKGNEWSYDNLVLFFENNRDWIARTIGHRDWKSYLEWLNKTRRNRFLETYVL